MALAKLQIRWIAALLAVTALVAIACGGSATATPLPTAAATPAPTNTPEPSPAPQVEATILGTELTVEEAAYIEQVRAGWNEFHTKAGGFREAFGQLYAMQSRLFEALSEAGAGSAFEPVSWLWRISTHRNVSPTATFPGRTSANDTSNDQVGRL